MIILDDSAIIVYMCFNIDETSMAENAHCCLCVLMLYSLLLIIIERFECLKNCLKVNFILIEAVMLEIDLNVAYSVAFNTVAIILGIAV